MHRYQANHGGEALEILAKSTYWNHGPDSLVKPTDRIELTVVLMDQEMVSVRSWNVDLQVADI